MRTKILLLVLALGILSVSGYKIYKTSFVKPVINTYEECVNAKGSRILETYPQICVTKSNQRFTQPVAMVSTQPTPDATANWKIFTEEGYSFKYPANSTYEERVAGFFAFLENPEQKANILFSVDQRDSGKSLPTYKTEEEKNLVSLSISDISNNNIQGFISEGDIGPGFAQGSHVKSAYIDLGEKVIVISCGSNKLCQDSILEGILTSFQIQKPTAPSANPDYTLEKSEGSCTTDSQCQWAGEGCGGGHGICTNDPSKYKDTITTCDVVPDFPANLGYTCGCIETLGKCGWKK